MSTLKTTALILIMVLSAGIGQAGVLPQNPEKAKAEKSQQIAKKRGAMIQIGSMPSSKGSEFKKGAAITIGSYPLTEG
ncbi:MAG TPA: hypothetical protein PLT76_07985 [Candidatus Omnitrophota bacterium]|nr:hypothetical protein [Candidatus Omnitrophota bacterium]HPB68415.1 hypothetical protein [Candidatus Omnitrophota bacterium]HQO58643.1 hypothetical protein [Candidatus Omnitrophota bacterium]HQP12035.1 hypothetical protein [Candidatus Omnitrophota bacterium]